MHHIFINENIIDVASSEIKFCRTDDEETFKHLVDVLRARIGEKVLISVVPFNMSFDYRTSIKEVTSSYVTFVIEEKLDPNELPVEVNLYQGICKGDKFDYIIEKAVELGVNSITPVAMEYSVAKIEEKKEEIKIARFNKIAKSAAEQSKRSIIPEVKKPIFYKDLVEKIAYRKECVNLLFYENAEGLAYTRELFKKLTSLALKDKIIINVIIGPEGGFSDKEVDLAKAQGIHILSLGPRILRTETATVTALSILMYELENRV